MLSYRHIYHAGNFADVVKHVVLVALLDALTRKSSPCYVHDSHAGAGLYALDSNEALHNREFESGIGRLWQYSDTPPLVERYLEIVRQWNPGQAQVRLYPGSPAIIQALLRQQDRLLLTELHPRDHQALLQQFRDDKRIQVHKQDAYLGLKAFLPPAEKRGLVLIDPPYERKDEYQRVITALAASHARWPGGVYAIWYPILSRSLQTRLLDACQATGIRKILHAEFYIAPPGAGRQFVGCGLLLVNPPWQIETSLAECLHWLEAPLRREGNVGSGVSWLVPE